MVNIFSLGIYTNNKPQNQIIQNSYFYFKLNISTFIILFCILNSSYTLKTYSIKSDNFFIKTTLSDKLSHKNIESTHNVGMSNLQLKMKLQLEMQVNTFIGYYQEYTKININESHLKKIKEKSLSNSRNSKISSDRMYSYYNRNTILLKSN